MATGSNCIRCGQGFRDLVSVLFGVSRISPEAELRCFDVAACDFRAFGRVLNDPATHFYLHKHRPGVITMRGAGGRDYDRYTEPVR